LSASTLPFVTSKPMTWKPALPNSTTSGSPTYPSPSTPIVASRDASRAARRSLWEGFFMGFVSP
jgi:hypothetical protein